MAQNPNMTNWMLLTGAEYKSLSTVKGAVKDVVHKTTLSLENHSSASPVHALLMANFNFYFLTESLISYAFLQPAQQF